MTAAKHFGVFILVFTMLVFSGCSTVILGNGTLSVAADSIDHITISNHMTGSNFTVESRDSIQTIVSHINSYTLENGSEAADDICQYHLYLTDTKGEELLSFIIEDETGVTTDQLHYSVDAKALLHYIEKLECDTMTDEELINSLITGNTMDDLNILNENGEISLDKIAGLADSCPALFELISRPTVIQSVGTYGIEAIQTYLNSGDVTLQERAETLAEFLKEYFPDLSEQIDGILGNN